MKARSAGELTELIDEDLATRKRELTTYKYAIDSATGDKQQAFMRGGVCLLYAHWEGFVRSSCKAYLSYVSRKGPRLMELIPALAASSLHGQFQVAEGSLRLIHRTSLIANLWDPDLRAALDIRVETGANLNSVVFRGVAELFCANYPRDYATKEKLLDQKLLAKRNDIAHGELVQVDADDYRLLHSEVISLLDRVRTDVQNAAVRDAFKRNSTAT
jgi:hypothetical protein